MLRNTGFVLVTTVGILFSVPLLWTGYPDPTHDGRIHAQWLDCFARQFWGGELYPRWLSEPNQGFGSAAFFFYSPLPFYLGSLFWLLAPAAGKAGIALGWAAALSLILSGLAALCCFRRFVASESAATVGAIFYMLAPYHLAIDLLDRGANAEFWAFVWLPLIISALQDLGQIVNTVPYQAMTGWTCKGFLGVMRRCGRTVLRLGLVIAGLFLTHPLTAVAFAPVATVFALFCGRRCVLASVPAVIIALALTAVYWLPLYSYREFTQGSQMGWINGELIENTVFFPSLSWAMPLLYDTDFHRRLLSLFRGFVLIWLLANITLVTRNLNRLQNRNMLLWSAVLGGCLFMMLPVAVPVYRYVPPLRHIQFSWRFMACATLAQSCIICVVLDALSRKAAEAPANCRLRLLGLASSAAILVTSLYFIVRADAQKYREGFWDHDGKFRSTPLIISPTDPDSHGEHVPIAASSQKAHEIFPTAGKAFPSPMLLGPGGKVNGRRPSARHWTLEVDAVDRSMLVIPQFWFPGWAASTRDTKENFRIQRAKGSGLLLIEVPPGQYVIDLRLRALGPEMLGAWITLATVCGLCFGRWLPKPN